MPEALSLEILKYHKTNRMKGLQVVLRIPIVLVTIILTSQYSYSQNETNRVALVIGVKDYKYVSPLSNTLNDAIDVSNALQEQGFNVIQLLNPSTKREMQDGILKYYDLIASTKNTAGLIYYSGHGLQVDGKNYLMPTSSNPRIKADLDDQAVNMTYILSAMEQADNGLNIFILDACRNSPFRSFSRSANSGLSQVNAPKGSYIVYATSPGSVASDGQGRNGLFTSKLLKYINQENISLESVFKNVAREVQQASKGEQVPWINYSYFGDFYFNSNTRKYNKTSISENQYVRANEASGNLNIKDNSNDQHELNSTSAISISDNTNGNSDTTNKLPIYLSFNNEYDDVENSSTVIGNQEWMNHNLNVSTFRNGDKIPQALNNKDWKSANKNKQPAWCYYKNDPNNGRIYGKLYNWYAVNDPRGLAPKGWHIPSSNEFSIVIMEIAGNDNAGDNFKSTSYWKNNPGNNSSGFSALPSGFRYTDASFNWLERAAGWWTISESEKDRAWYFSLTMGIGGFPGKKGAGYAVRCIRD